MDIKELLTRRSDLSTFLVHLTRDYEGTKAKDNLKSILSDSTIEARNPFGSAVTALEKANPKQQEDLDTQKVVCFTETPLEYVRLLAGNIERRKYKFEPYGIVITKRDARMNGVNPIWYLDMSQGIHQWLTKPLDRLIETEISNKTFMQSDVAELTPFIEQMGSNDATNFFKEYWWEREWRRVGDFFLPLKYIIICPEKDWTEVEQSSPRKLTFIDSTWSLEQIIGRLAGYDSEHIDQF